MLPLLLPLLFLPLIPAHMQLSHPYPLRSPLNPSTPNPDLTNPSPLHPSGSGFPCKNFTSDPFHPVATYLTGHSYSIRLTEGEPHGGGSCQISLSYDSGRTFRVIKSIIGSCPLAREYGFVVPGDAPVGEALLAWTWFNRLGYREMYMNCAQVLVVSGEDASDKEKGGWGGWRRGYRHRHSRRENSDEERETIPFDQRPEIFLSNIGDKSPCKTIKGREVIFPDPGPDVEYAYDVDRMGDKGYICSELEAEDTSMSMTSLHNSISSSSSSTSTTLFVSTSTATVTRTIYRPAETASTSITTSDAVAFAPAGATEPEPDRAKGVPPAAAADLDGVTIYRNPKTTASPTDGARCTPYTVQCHSEDTYSLCIEEGIFAFMGKVGAGVECVDNEIRLTNI